MVTERGTENISSKEQLVVIVMGSKSDLEYAKKITEVLDRFNMTFDIRVASAHKSTEYLLEMIEDYNEEGKNIVYIAVAGRSNALGGTIAGNTSFPVINTPPYSEKFSGADVFSSLNNPSNIPVATILDSENAGLFALRVFALSNPDLLRKLDEYQSEVKRKVEEDDIKLQNGFSSQPR